MELVKGYHFIIMDTNTENYDCYDYYGNFLTTAEVLQFMKENRAEGNAIKAVDVDFVTLDCMDLRKWEYVG